MRFISPIKPHNLIYSWAIATVFILCVSLDSNAQGLNSSTYYLPPGQSPNQGAPPAPGDGPNSAAVIPGDANQASPFVPTGQPVSSPVNGTPNSPFTKSSETRRSRINLMMKEAAGRGERTVLTFQPDQLTPAQYGQVMGILGAPPSSDPYQNITVTQQQLEQMQKALNPYPVASKNANSGHNGKSRSQIVSDYPTSGRLSKNGTNGEQPTTLVIRQFCRYLVKMGVVCGCVFMAFAAVAVIFGDRNAGGRVIAAMAGIMMLLMAYSIWKVVRSNEDNARGPTDTAGAPRAMDLSQQQALLPSRDYRGDTLNTKNSGQLVSPVNANLPLVLTPEAPPRTGLPLLPLGARH